jgi:hypothetical protein
MRELVATGYGQFVSAAVMFTADVGRAAGPRRRRRSFFDLARIFFVGASEGQGAGCPRVPVPVPAPRLRLTSLSVSLPARDRRLYHSGPIRHTDVTR